MRTTCLRFPTRERELPNIEIPSPIVDGSSAESNRPEGYRSDTKFEFLGDSTNDPSTQSPPCKDGACVRPWYPVERKFFKVNKTGADHTIHPPKFCVSELQY